MKIGIFVAVCEKDFVWFPQFTKQAEILGYPVAFFADKLSPESLETLRAWKGTHYVYENSCEQFSERSKEKAFKGLQGFDWAIQMDIDETWEEGAKEKIEKALEENPEGHLGDCRMITVARHEGELYQRMDKYFANGRESHRERIYNMKFEWHWIDPITCGAYLFIDGSVQNECKLFPCEAATVHWGYSTYELCDEHKDKWTTVYTTVWGKMPYAAYDMLTDKAYEFEKIPLDKKYYTHVWIDQK